jgi:predicted RNA binding protein YcfA (HicA-like mRNA interferase family)
MPGKVRQIKKVARLLGFEKVSHKSSAHSHWKHADGRRITISDHGCNEIRGGLFHKSLKDLCITEDEFNRLK